MLIRFDVPKDLGEMLQDMNVRESISRPAVDVTEYENETVVVAEVPGVRKEDIKLTIEQDILTIAGERKQAEVSDTAKVLLNEHRTRAFSRTLRVGHPIDRDAISATLEFGVLTIRMPKDNASRTKNITIR